MANKPSIFLKPTIEKTQEYQLQNQYVHDVLPAPLNMVMKMNS